MYWLLLVVAAVTFYFGLRTPSTAVMLGFFLIGALSVTAWAWLRYRLLFPARDAQMTMTPMDRAEIERLRQQAQAARTQGDA